MTHSLYTLLESRSCWLDKLHVPTEAQKELEFWSRRDCLADYDSQPIWHSPSAVRVVYSDASNTGYGGYVVEHGTCVTYGLWSSDEANQSSTWRELMAVHRVLEAMAVKLKNCRVRWFTDNQNVARIMSTGSRKPPLQSLALAVFTLAVKYQSEIRLEPEWIPRELNEKDYLSCIVDYDDWQLNPVVFAELDKVWGTHTVDCFANYQNSQLPCFNSRCWNPGSEAVDSFTVNWAWENWWCPPISPISRVIIHVHAQVCKARGTMVVPQWLSVPFWPLLWPFEFGTGVFAPFVRSEGTSPL